MDKDTRTAIERATQRARKLLEEDFAAQLEGDFDVHKGGAVATKAGGHLSARQAFQRERIVAAIEHKRAAGMSAADAARDYLRDAAFTTLNRFVALKMLEARELVQECMTKGEQSGGYREFCGMAPGLPLLPESTGYRLYLESLFDELSTEVKVLFDRRDPSSVLWPKRATFEQLLEILNATELARVWAEDETIGWVYQFFNGQDERKKMREESQAPRNSRELAVRNQFFTPRYVVQFLTDNTLGRIWYEMRGTKTVLADRCDYMVRKPHEEFVPRAKKDPRDLRVLDPACGSGHFLLYAFDLLVAIYEEAYADPESPKSEATGKALSEDYPSVEALRKEVPGLVLAHNLHGVDIDPRCAQIAQLALWMRAQKAYRDFGIGRAERAQIRRSNIVVAEPLVADEQIAKEFVASLSDVELGRVFTSLVESLRLACDLGLLLRVEQLVARQAKRGQTGDLFAPLEERIRAALAQFVNDDKGRANTRRRLFIDDAAQAIGLLSIAEQTFDTVLMNPPFGDGSMRARRELDGAYPRTKNDIYAAFVERGIELLSTRGLLGAITSRTGFFLTSFQKWREDIVLSIAPPLVFADLGLGVMDSALVEAAAYCLEKRAPDSRGTPNPPTTFLRALEEVHQKDMVLRSAIRMPASHIGKQRFEVTVDEFRGVPGSPFAYWVSQDMRAVFGRSPAFESNGREARQGLATADDFRFVRLWWEIPIAKDATWFPYAKGGKYSPFYFDLHLVVNWQNDGRQIVTFCKPGSARPASRPQNTGYFFRAGLTWPRRTKSELSFRVMPSGCVFGDKGPAAFVSGDNGDALLAILAIATSKSFRALIEFQLAAAEPTGRGGVARSYEVGVVQRTPLPNMSNSELLELAQLARRAWSLRRSLDAGIETSHAFVRPNLGPLVDKSEQERAALQRTIDRRVSELYGLLPDSGDLGSHFVPGAAEPVDDADDADDDDSDVEIPALENVAVRSWLVGVAFGRFDSIHTPSREPEPFDELPRFAPGMVASTTAVKSVLVDDEGHADDLVAEVVANAERNGVRAGDDLREWLAKEYFPLHIKMYSKSRRKAPIYWQLATPSASYSVWLYIHALSKDTLFCVQNDYVAPKLAHEERRLESLTSELRDGATAAQRKALAAHEVNVEELRGFVDEVKRVAPLWKPNLDDGVIINFAPLWRLVPQNKSWQKELKSTWDALCEGKYDWAHLAMHLWPERVVPKCAKDRSLAVAHELEDVFWVAGTDGKLIARKRPTRSVDELIRERTSPAVKSALKGLLEAPAAAGKSTGRKGGGRRKATAAAEGGDA